MPDSSTSGGRVLPPTDVRIPLGWRWMVFSGCSILAPAVCHGTRPGANALPSLLQAKVDGRLRGHQLGGDLVPGAGGAATADVSLDVGPELLPDVRRDHLLQVLEGGAAQVAVVGVEGAEGDPDRLGR